MGRCDRRVLGKGAHMYTNHGLLLAVFPLLLVLGCPDTTDTDRNTDLVLKSPDEAIMHYFDGITKNDVKTILEACAIDEVSENFNFALFAESMDRVDFFSALSPANYPFYSDINRAYLSSQILSEVKMLCFSLLSCEDVEIVSPMDSGRASRFMKETDPARLSSLKIQRICFPIKSVENSVIYLERAGRQAKLNAADEATERLVLFLFEESYYYVGFSLLRYGQSWKIKRQSCMNTSFYGTAQKTTKEEFEDTINE